MKALNPADVTVDGSLKPSVVSILNRLIKLNTNGKGGGPAFRSDLDAIKKVDPSLSEQVDSVAKVFKANSSGKAKAKLLKILQGKDAGAEDEEEEDEEQDKEEGEEEEEEEEGEDGDGAGAEVTMDVDEGDEEEGDQDEDDEKYGQYEDFSNKTPTSLLTRPYLTLLTKDDFSYMERAIESWRHILTSDLPSAQSVYVQLSEATTPETFKSLLDPSKRWSSLSVEAKVNAFSSLCDAPLLLDDRTVIEELKSFDFKSLRPVKPTLLDSYGRAYFYHPALQPAMSIRIFRTVGSWRPGKTKMYQVKGADYAGFMSKTDPRDGWECVAENAGDLEVLLANSALFTDPDTKVLKNQLTQSLETVRWEEDKLKRDLERQRKKDYFASLPRRVSRRRGGGEEEDDIPDDVKKAFGLA